MTDQPATVDYGAWAALRLREGVEIASLDTERIKAPWVEFLGVCRALNGGDRRAAYEQWTRHHPDGKRIISQVFAVPAHLVEYPEPPLAPVTEAVVYVDLPELPREARITQAMERAASDTGRFLAEYSAHVTQVANTIPTEFSEAAALSLASIAVARRLHFPTYFEPEIFPNLWVLWVAESTVFHKTTGLNIARRLIRSVMPHLLLPEETSGDRLIQEMAGMDPANYAQLPLRDQQRWQEAKLYAGQRGIAVDEASALFSGFRKDYNIGKVETFLKAYDCDPEKVFSTIRHGNIYFRHLYMSLLGATTPAAIQQAANLNMWQIGFWPRFVLLVPERMFPEKIQHSEELIPRPATLDRAITRLLGFLPEPEEPSFGTPHGEPPKSIAATRSTEVWKRWTQYNDALSHTLQNPDLMPDSRLRVLYGRLPVKLLKVMTLLAALDWDGQGGPRVEMCHFARAHQICEDWRASAHRFVEVMDRPLAGEDRERRLLNTIRTLTDDASHAATTREIQRSTGWPRDQVDALLDQMQKDGMIESTENESKRTRIWKVVERASAA